MDKPNETSASAIDEAKLKVMVMRSNALRTAITEVINEHRDEIIKRARAKLLAQGLTAEDANETGGF